jgi:outer membrane protein OmpA-like peptidoglycan-associated protein
MALGIVVLLLGGCGGAQPLRKMATARLARAAHFLDTVRSLELAQTDPAGAAGAETALEAARAAFADGDFPAARQAADASAAASRELLRRYYRETVARLAERVRKALEERSRQDPEDPLAERIPALDAVAARVDRLAANPQVVSVSRVLGDLETVLAVSDSLRASWRRTLPADDAFAPGTDELSEAGAATLDALAASVREADAPPGGEAASAHYFVKVVGYTDQLNFGRNTPLAAHLSRGVEDQAPETDPERRRFLNRRLSRFRAEAVAEALADRLEGDGVKVTAEAVGRGETVPPQLPPPYPAADPRRRICRVFIHLAPPDGFRKSKPSAPEDRRGRRPDPRRGANSRRVSPQPRSER